MLRPLVTANHVVSLCGTLLSTVGVDVDLATYFVIKISSSAAQRTQERGTGAMVTQFSECCWVYCELKLQYYVEVSSGRSLIATKSSSHPFAAVCLSCLLVPLERT